MEIVGGAQKICWTRKSNTPGKERKKENQSVENQSASKDRSRTFFQELLASDSTLCWYLNCSGNSSTNIPKDP
jgi:hypothetical protein